MSISSTPALLDELVALLRAELPDLVGIYLFGSFASDAQRADSDIDLGLQTEAPIDPQALFLLSGRLATIAGRDVDLVDMRRCSTVMRAQIIATGKLIYCRDRFRCDDFAATAWSAYAHLNEARRGILEDIARTGRIHGR